MEGKKVMDEFIEERTRQVVEELKAIISNRPDREVSFFLVVNDKDGYNLTWGGLENRHIVRMFANMLQDESFSRIAKIFFQTK